MESKLDYKGVDIKISDEGTGVPVVLIHGYLESSEIWQSFSERLKDSCRIIRIDLPGHGESELIKEVQTMELMAEVIRFVLDALFLDKCILIGHSLGGYVSLAFAEMYPERLMGFSLFHSTPFPDTEEKKQQRNREIELVIQNKKDLIFNTNIPKEFADDNLVILAEEVERVKNIAGKTSERGIVSMLEGMKLRPDRSKIIALTGLPFLLILGKKDNYIPFEVASSKIGLNKNGRLCVLENSGHLGFVEEPEKSLECVKSFVEQCRNIM